MRKRERTAGDQARAARGWWRWFVGVRVSSEGWYYLLIVSVVLIIGFSRQMNVMLILAGMLLGPLFYNWRSVVRGFDGFTFRRLVPSGICAGDLLVVRWEATNTHSSRHGCSFRIQDQLHLVEPGAATLAARPAVFFLHIPPGKSETVSYEGRLFRRGRYEIGPAVISTRFPFGLIEHQTPIFLKQRIVVYPRLGRLTEHWWARRREEFEGAHQRGNRETRMSGEFFGVREWQAGDSRRWIHWRSSARHGTLVVRQFEQPRNRDVAILLDLGFGESTPTEDAYDSPIEIAVSFAATILSQLCREGGTSVALGTTTPEAVCIHGPASTPLLRSGMELLAVSQPPRQDCFGLLWRKLTAVIEPGTEVVLITVRERDAVSMLPNGQQIPTRVANRQLTVMRVPSEELKQAFCWE